MNKIIPCITFILGACSLKPLGTFDVTSVGESAIWYQGNQIHKKQTPSYNTAWMLYRYFMLNNVT